MDWNYCPACGHRIYQHTGPASYAKKWDGGCTHVETTGHVVKATENNRWTLKHPVAERDSDNLFDCKVNKSLIAGMTVNGGRIWLPLGEHAIVENPDGSWSFEPADKARTKCGCTVPYSALLEHRV